MTIYIHLGHQLQSIFLAIGMIVLQTSNAWAQVNPTTIKKPVVVSSAQQQAPIPANKICTKTAKADWLSEEEFLILMKHRGYTIQNFKVVYESCYEVYGFDKDKRIVEAYFNPQNAKLNRQNFVAN
jgi:hypothetical protein